MVGLLVYGDNHFVVRGPEPDPGTALALVRHWSLIRIGQRTPPELSWWRISIREFREDLQWAVVVTADEEHSPAVSVLLEELRLRGVAIRHV